MYGNDQIYVVKSKNDVLTLNITQKRAKKCKKMNKMIKVTKIIENMFKNGRQVSKMRCELV
jgi:hypothetical protein